VEQVLGNDLENSRMGKNRRRLALIASQKRQATVEQVLGNDLKGGREGQGDMSGEEERETDEGMNSGAWQ